MTGLMMMVMMIQPRDVENNRDSVSDESGPEEVEPVLLRKQLLEVGGVFCHQRVSFSVSPYFV